MVEHDYTLDDRQTALVRRLRDENRGLWAKSRELEAKNSALDRVIAGQRANIRGLLRRLNQQDGLNENAELRAKLALTESFQAGEPFLDMVESVNKAEKG